MSFWSKFFGPFKRKPRTEIDISRNDILPPGKSYQEQIEDDYKLAVEYYINSPNPKFHRTTRDEELAFNFSSRHYETLEPLESKVYEETGKVFSIWSIDERIEQCKKAISSYEKLKKFCLSKGKGGSIHFEDMWEHCHNSKKSDFRYIEDVEQELELLTKNYEEASKNLQSEKLAYEKRQRVKDFKKSADNLLIEFITENNGILQKDLYKQFEIEYKTAINSTLKKLHGKNKIIRIKEGNSYKLFIVTK